MFFTYVMKLLCTDYGPTHPYYTIIIIITINYYIILFITFFPYIPIDFARGGLKCPPEMFEDRPEALSHSPSLNKL